MRAMILAAGRGERMYPLTVNKPKPLLEVRGKPLIRYQVEKLVTAGIREIVINHAVMGEQIEACLGDGRDLGARIEYSAEGNMPLDTGGGIYRALPLLGNEPFLVINADVWTEYPMQRLPATLDGLAHLILVNNPDHNPEGDFAIQDGCIAKHGSRRYTYSGIGVYSTDLFRDCHGGVFALAPLIRRSVEQGNRITAEFYPGLWLDIGTPERLQSLERMME